MNDGNGIYEGEGSVYLGECVFFNVSFSLLFKYLISLIQKSRNMENYYDPNGIFNL